LSLPHALRICARPAVDADRRRLAAAAAATDRLARRSPRPHLAVAPRAVQVARGVSLGVAGVAHALPAPKRRAGPRELRRRPAVVVRRAIGALKERLLERLPGVLQRRSRGRAHFWSSSSSTLDALTHRRPSPESGSIR